MPFRLTPGTGALVQLEDPRKTRRVEVTPAVAARARYLGEASWVDGLVMITFLDATTNLKLMQYQPE